MFRLMINGRPCEVREDATIMDALQSVDIEVPVLCHDTRLQPSGACRLCVVEVKGWNRHATACNTPVFDGMEIKTHSPSVEDARRTLLRLLARDYPAESIAAFPDKPFHRLLRHYGIEAVSTTRTTKAFRDATHPYLHVDMAQCINCYRCVRICDEVQGQFVWRVWDRGAAPRILPDSGATLLSSSCVSCGACVDTCPTGALEDQSVLAQGLPEKWTRTTCPYCGTGCEMLVGTRGNQIVQVKPVIDAPVSKGHLCVKGRYAFGFTHARDRVTEPMIREGGGWRKTTWSEAMTFVAARFSSILASHGPDSIGVLGSARGTNEENYLAQKFARVVLGTNNVDCCARVCHAPTATGLRMTFGTGAATNSFDDIECASTFLLCGCNPTENHPIVGARIKQAVLRGARLIVIDPREIELARYATIHLQLRPGTNIPLLNALANVVVTEGLTDECMLRERTRDSAEFRTFIAGWTPERAATICGVDAELIRKAARLYATGRPSMCFHGLGTTEHMQGTDGVVCLANLALLTGNVGLPGAGVNPLRGQNNVQGSAHMGCEPDYLTGYVPLESARDVFESTWSATLPRTRGLNLMEMVDAAADNRLHALWAIGYDIAQTNPNSAATKAALGQLDLIVVQDLFLNELAREFGHVFLPACSPFEKDGTFMNSERRVQRVRRALDPIGQSKADWEIICEVARTMGHGPQFAYHSAEEIWNEIRHVWRAGAGLGYERLEAGGLQWPCPTDDHPGTTILHTEAFPAGKTAPLVCVDFHATSEVVDTEFPFLLTTGRTLYQFNAGTMTMRTPNAQLRHSDALDVAPADAERLQLHEGETVLVRSRHGQARLPIHADARLQPGELFATFHVAGVSLNQLTGPNRDTHTLTPEYKVVAVSLEKLPAP
ncbi:MAG: formate dehydrogenase subunit alpha [Chthoniobacter sp.]|nr:formate dehydrogenase subunit alpha [Chthoniobacter sp.]